MKSSKVKLEELQSRLIVEFKSEALLVKNVKELSKTFTVDRDKLKNYVLDDFMVAAYTYFYMTTNMPKFHFIMEQLPETIKSWISCHPFIDVGMGPGTYLWSFLDYLSDSTAPVYGVDRSPLMIKQANLIKDAYYHDRKVILKSYLPEDVVLPTLFFGNSINEIGIPETTRIIKRYNPPIIFFIEPGTKGSFKLMNVLRSSLLSDGYSIVYPCPSKGPCQMSEDDWCHQVLKTDHGQVLERFSQLASLDRKTMPLVSHLYVRDDLANSFTNHSSIRLVQIIKETKFSYLCQVCLENNQLKQIEFLKKYMDKKTVKDFRSCSIGITIGFEKLKDLQDGTIRAKLTEWQ